MNINNNLIKIINSTTKIENYLDYEYLIYLLRKNYKKLIFLGNKRNHDVDNQNISQNKIFAKLNCINNNNFQNNTKNKLLEINNDLKKQYCLKNNKNFESNNLNKKQFIIENTINENNIDSLTLNQFIKKNKINIIDKEFFDTQKKVIKYNKKVYVNKYTIKKKIKKKKNNNGKNKRSSKYRGVSKNGQNWQVIMMSKKNKPYIGTYNSEEIAARIYDIASIKKNGINAKTNFLYNSEQIERIFKINIDFKSKNISKDISELIK